MEPYATAENIDSKTLAWLEQIRPYNQHEMRLNVAASVLLVVDHEDSFLGHARTSFCNSHAHLSCSAARKDCVGVAWYARFASRDPARYALS